MRISIIIVSNNEREYPVINMSIKSLLIISVIIPFFVHLLNQGPYNDPWGGVFWIGSIGTTLPFAVLALITFLKLRSSNVHHRVTLFALLAGWIPIMALTLWVISWERNPGTSSTIGLAIGFTPIIYFFIMIISYAVGRIVGHKFFVTKNAK